MMYYPCYNLIANKSVYRSKISRVIFFNAKIPNLVNDLDNFDVKLVSKQQDYHIVFESRKQDSCLNVSELLDEDRFAHIVLGISNQDMKDSICLYGKSEDILMAKMALL